MDNYCRIYCRFGLVFIDFKSIEFTYTKFSNATGYGGLICLMHSLIREVSFVVDLFTSTAPLVAGKARFKPDGICAETRFVLSAKRTSPFKLAGGQFSRLLAVEVCASAVAMVVMLDTSCSEVQCKTTGWLPTALACFPFISPTVCHQVSTELYRTLFDKNAIVTQIYRSNMQTLSQYGN